MKEINDKWPEEVFRSMKGSTRAKPRAELFHLITNQINQKSAQVIPLYQLRNYAAAVGFILLINLSVLTLLNSSEKMQSSELVASDMDNQSLVKSYQIYGQ